MNLYPFWKKTTPAQFQLEAEPPLRAELFSAAQMEQHGRVLAGLHGIQHDQTPDQLLPRLADNERELVSVCSALTATVQDARQITPAAEWLLDNFYLIEEQIRTAKQHLPKGYSKELPRLAKGPSSGKPRVYDIALETIAHGDGRVDHESLSRFVSAYQHITVLKLGELWAIPIMLRLALIENLRRVAIRIAAGRASRHLADVWADQMIAIVDKDPSSLILLVADMARSNPTLDGSFVAELMRRLQGQSPILTLPLNWVSQRLVDVGSTIDQMVHIEAQQQAADQVSISNSIGSLRSLAAIDWRVFVEEMSHVEHTLRQDQAQIYQLMDFATRDAYRHVIENLAKTSTMTEVEVAKRALALSQHAATKKYDVDTRTLHIGFYLVGRGLDVLELAIGAHYSWASQCLRRMKRSPLGLYLGAIALMALMVTAILINHSAAHGVSDEMLIALSIVTLLATSQLSVALVNWLVTLLATPHPLPRMDYSKGIPNTAKTLVVVPTMLINEEGVENLCESLEVAYLANRDPSLRFCLLTDFMDAATETMAEDGALLAQVSLKIAQLNSLYGYVDPLLAASQLQSPFLLLHRARRWNAEEQVWMGHERKRGKLADLNAFLLVDRLQATQTRFASIVGDTEALADTQFVITLDTDTQLPRDTARQMIATMAHPLNRAHFDASQSTIVEGYGILQPRMVSSLPAANASLYEKLCGGEAGIDPYTRTVSDVYQDIFQEGSFIGKGIYDLHAFEHALNGQFPDNRILSHDLLEGCYARSGLISDIQLHETAPSHFNADVCRRHRWIRGDWQLLPWLFTHVPVGVNPANREQVHRRRNPISMLSHWKIFDNLRRSLIAVSLMLLLMLGWGWLPSAGLWTGAVLTIIFLPSVAASLLDLLHKSREVLIRQHIVATLRTTKQHLAQAMLHLIFLPYEAFYSTDAILRSVWRASVSHRHILQWNPSNLANQQAKTHFSAYWRSMWMAPVWAMAIAAGLAVFRPTALTIAWPLILLWLASPAIAWRISCERVLQPIALSLEQIAFLNRLARKTWAFFDTYMGSNDHWLPPDNMQEHPVFVVAHRTSPTNIGLALLANVAAYDFGYIAQCKLIHRTHNTLVTLAKLERYQGHFYNWYDTQSLQPLYPMYVSTVDSGNLAGYLITLQGGLNTLADQAIISPRVFEGLQVTFQLVAELLPETPSDALQHFRSLIAGLMLKPPSTLINIADALETLATSAQTLQQSLDPESEASRWAMALLHQCQDAAHDLHYLAPWLTLPDIETLSHDFAELNAMTSLHALASLEARIQQVMEDRIMENVINTQLMDNWIQLPMLVKQASQRAVERIAEIQRLARLSAEFARMDYGFLYDEPQHLLSIGYNVSDRRIDPSCYDLLASEARLCSFVAIAQGQLSQETWFALGRQLTVAGGEPILLSWSGSMFEYLMPLLVMPDYEDTLLNQTYRAVVARQIEYGTHRGVPWGISESGYHTFDASLNYQYRAFGVPGLGLKRGLADDLVVAPYATMLALMVAPEQAYANLRKLVDEGLEGQFGMYEAIDYTVSRLQRGRAYAVIRSYMAHHQGMSLLSLNAVLLDHPMQTRFTSDPLCQATLLLLKERIPKPTAFYANPTELLNIHAHSDEPEMPMRVISRVDSRLPEVQLLSNGRYHVMITNAGGSYSRWLDLAVTRWREDSTCDQWGTFCYVRDLADDSFWSTSYHPTLVVPKNYEVIFSEGRAEFRRHDRGLDMHTEIVVSPEDDIELRRTRITNRSRVNRMIDVTSYAEVVLAPAAADNMHPAFSNLFVQTEILHDQNAILCNRRPRSESEVSPLMFHLMAVHGVNSQDISYETDRMAFIGRGNTVASPLAMARSTLTNSQGSVLDPIVAIRHQFTLLPEQTVIVDMVTGVADVRENALRLIEKYRDLHLADRVFELAWTHSQVVLRQLNASEADAQLYGRLANSIIYAHALMRADTSILIKNHRGQSGLWSYAISGDLPIVLLHISDVANIELVRQMVQAHAYWRMKGLAVDLVIWNEDHAGYRQLLQDQIMGLVASGIEPNSIERPGGIFVRLADQIPDDDRILLQSVARVMITDGRGTLGEQINRRTHTEVRMPPLVPYKKRVETWSSQTLQPVSDLQFDNGIGGFSADGREYVVTTTDNIRTPAPWVNVLANAHFGTVISESGQSYTWAENAHEFRLTPWSNDPVSDGGGEVFYVRDEESGHFWSPTPLPRRGDGPYVSRHGFGYSEFEHVEDGIHSNLTVYVALDASIKYSVLKIRNDSDQPRRLSATGYVEWVLGDLRHKSAMHVISEVDPATGALFARNAYNTEFPDRIAFFYVDAMALTMSGDRTEFIGRNGSLQNPAVMSRTRLSGKLGAGLDPCAAIQIPIELAEGESREVIFILGVAARRSADVSDLIRRFRGAVAAHEALEAVKHYWDKTLGAVQILTPDPSINLLANGWLVYQTIACRVWARSGFYQSGGAFGFRDQLQDVMALIYSQPHMAREQILLCAAHQFVEGDVQHWWHPPSNRGVRTHCSDDYLWLPLATSRYVSMTQDTGVLDEIILFLEGRAVNADEDSYYDLPVISNQAANLYDHCKRAVLHGLRFGIHGLPLIGSCDWNDGMDKVGSQGKGESVWLGFFLYEVLTQFTAIAQHRGDVEFANACLTHQGQLQGNIEKNAWDGGWYRRAYFDDGTPLGSANNQECQIDSISQSWSVLSGVASPERMGQAMQAMYQRLVRTKDSLVQLLDPPFDQLGLNPGYIRGYVPGVRENGGQYTHAAIWAAMAFAKLGDSEHAWNILQMINPVNHGRTGAEIKTYRVEPYVVAADVYGVSPHVGRGGWTWYTGSSGWMYRLIMESLLGLTLRGDQLSFNPCLPAGWDGYKLHYRYLDTDYQIMLKKILNGLVTHVIDVDGVTQATASLTMVNDGQLHKVSITFS